MNEPVPTNRPLIWTSLRPVHTDYDSLRRALAKLAEDDPGFRVDDVDGQIVIRTMSEPHLEGICERLVREHDIYVECGELNIIYLETVRKPSEGEGKFIRQTGVRATTAMPRFGSSRIQRRAMNS